MKTSPFKSPLARPKRKKASVLLITLGFVLLITVITVAFLVRSRSSLQTSQSYSNEIVAKEVGEIGINTLVAEFQKELHLAATNSLDILLPTSIGTTNSNPRDSAFIRRTWGDTNSINAAFISAGFPSIPYTNRASQISSTNSSKNGWIFAKQRWEKPGLLKTDSNGKTTEPFTPPDWVYVEGKSSSSTSTNNINIIGRYAAMIYDVGGLLDINEAGVPSTLALRDKGSTAFSDFSVIPNGSKLAASGNLFEWRAGENPNATNYYGYSPDYSTPQKYSESLNPKNAGTVESPTIKLKYGNNHFFSRMELIEAADAGKLGLDKALLPYLRTRSESGNRIAPGSYFVDGTTTAVRLGDPSLAATSDTTFTIDHIDGNTETYTIKTGAPLIQNRFPLARLRWLADRTVDGTPNPPADRVKAVGQTQALQEHLEKIKKYFGLSWDDKNKIFIYTSPDTSDSDLTPAKTIKTLAGLCKAINDKELDGNNKPILREPDFFEWLKAGIDPSSLGQTGGSTDREFSGSPYGTLQVPWEYSKDLHVLRIGANIIDQSDPDSIPTGIRSEFTNVTPTPFDSFGQENLPYLNEAIVSVYRPDANHLDSYLQFELWNPNREAYTDKLPRGYDGGSITGIRIGAIKGCTLMEPFVYMPSRYKYPNPNITPGKHEGGNAAWNCMQKVADFSKGEDADLANPDALKPAAYHPVDFESTNKFVPITFDQYSYNSSTGFFDEPFLANKIQPFGQDISNPTTKIGSSPGTKGYLGATPSDEGNGILLCRVDAPQKSFSDTRLACTGTTTPKGKKKSNNDGIYEYTAQGAPFGKSSPIHVAVTDKSGEKRFNAVNLFSYSGTINGVATSPITIQIEVQFAGSGWIPVQRYNNLAFSIYNQNQTEGRINGIISGSPNSQEEAAWISPTTTSYFTDWMDVSIRKGYPMCDPRTERFGLSDQNEATPGQGIYPEANTPFDGNGADSNMTCGTMAAVGSDLQSGQWDSQAKATTQPLEWSLIKPNVSMSVPAYLARNIWNGSTTSDSAYKDYDGIARPADACWVADTSHPGLPTATSGIKSARPTILDRPFRSVAELGCVFRDVPWKSLDLFSPYSADRRLLDIFSIEDSSITVGKINPNLAQVEILQALLRGTSLDPSASNPSIIPTQNADAVAAMLAKLNPASASDRITGGENLAKRLSESPDSAPKREFDGLTAPCPDSGTTLVPLSPLSSNGNFSSYKVETENFLRALSSTTDTRNWQLMLDVVAQAGRVAPQGADLQNFVVEGQRRFFVYLTLDRITGEIVDEHIEPVYE